MDHTIAQSSLSDNIENIFAKKYTLSVTSENRNQMQTRMDAEIVVYS